MPYYFQRVENKESTRGMSKQYKLNQDFWYGQSVLELQESMNQLSIKKLYEMQGTRNVTMFSALLCNNTLTVYK